MARMTMVMTQADQQARRDNDQHYKTLFRMFLRELLEMTHPDLVYKLQFHKAHYLDKETYTDLMTGQGYRLDLVCEIPTTDGEARLVLVHTEVEEREPRHKSQAEFSERIANYVMTLWLRHRVPVIPLVVSFSRQAVPPEVCAQADRVKEAAVLEAMCAAIAAAKDEAEARAQLDALRAR